MAKFLAIPTRLKSSVFFISENKINELSVNNQQTMSSLEISELTGKRHADVRADIERILNEAGIEGATFIAPFKMPSGQNSEVFNLPRRECDLVISGYSVKYRLAIIDRWHDLEIQPQFNIPTTFSEALRLSADLQEKVSETMTYVMDWHD